MLTAPEFWESRGPASTLLLPLAFLFGAAGTMRRAFARPFRAPVPVLCVGNLVAGGAGKTPVALALAHRLAGSGEAVHFITRGYGGSLAGPVAVDPKRHSAAEVGDEALLLSRAAPTWLARDRVKAAEAAVTAGASLLLLDDGFQNPALQKDLSLLVVDGTYGFGNGRVIPAGPLRERVGSGLARAQAAVLMGEDEARLAPLLESRLPLLRARVVPVEMRWRGRPVLAFAGIGRPAKFFDLLQRSGAELVARRSFPDHHPYRAAELEALGAEAAAAGATLVTTAKDRVRLPIGWRDRVEVLDIAVEWEDEPTLDALLEKVLRHG